MAIPALASDFKEFLKSLNSNGVEPVKAETQPTTWRDGGGDS
jgi:hypothetical protein